MKYSLGNKSITIKDEILDSYVSKLKVSRDEAIQIYLEDEGYAINAEQQELNKKAQENHITSTIHQARKSPTQRRKRTVKENPTKEMIIARIAEILPDFAENIKVENAAKIITFEANGQHFTLDLIQNRKK